MTDSQTKQIQAIQALLVERRKFEEWIAQLEARKESTPEHVFVKVHGDYVVRLTEAQAKLSSETGAVQKLASELRVSLAEQERAVGEKKDERSEAELRASVGEYSEKEWDKLRGKLDGAIADLTGERDTSHRELETLQALLAEAAGPGPSGHNEALPAPQPPPPPPPPPRASASLGKLSDAPALRSSTATARPAEPAPAAPAPARNASVEVTGGVDELAFLRSVLGRSTPYTGATGLPAVARPASAPVPEPAPRKPAAPRTSSAVPARPSVEARAPAPELFAAPEPPLPVPEPEPRLSEENETRPSGAFGAPTPRTSEAVRTLKCQECGTLNFPTEWYCERCGGELAAF
jgi:hypothetical protein